LKRKEKRRKKEKKKVQPQALACLISIVLSFIFALCD
jgi:hypothetical protein